ncbi:methyltransferase domain-containing protein [Sediminitomix flava]|nr:methyltransferase domain-containing protein [Sediminitomix flava]
MSFLERAQEEEIMDDLSINDDGLRQTLAELDVINKWLGGNNPTLRGVRKLLHGRNKNDEIVIVDMGCGSGEMLRLIDESFRGEFERLKLVGIDANPHVIAYAKSKSLGHDIEFSVKNVFEKNSMNCDIIISTLFLHHFNSIELESLIKKWQSGATFGVVINDIHRHWFAYYSIAFLTHFFSKSYMTKYDAKLSVKRAFKKKELSVFYEGMGWRSVQVSWCWAFRWLVILRN